MDFEHVLLAQVKSKPLLYLKSNSNYMNNREKEKAWAEIYQCCLQKFPFLTEAQIKQTWIDLKRRYKEALNASKTHSGDEFPEDVDWGILHELDFLKESVENRPVVSTLDTQPSIITDQGFSPITEIAKLQEERQLVHCHRTSNIWQSTQGVKAMGNQYAAILPEVVPRYEAFALHKQTVMSQSMAILQSSAINLKNMIDNLKEKNYRLGNENRNAIEVVQKEHIKELFLSIPLNQHRQFYLKLIEILERFK